MNPRFGDYFLRKDESMLSSFEVHDRSRVESSIKVSENSPAVDEVVEESMDASQPEGSVARKTG